MLDAFGVHIKTIVRWRCDFRRQGTVALHPKSMATSWNRSFFFNIRAGSKSPEKEQSSFNGFLFI